MAIMPRLVDVRHPRVADILAIGDWHTNADMIADVAKLGFIPEPVLDLTYGIEGGFWKTWCPDNLETNDLYVPADHHFDFRATDLGSRSSATVVFDPPYGLSGTPALGEMDDRYGTQIARSRAEIYALLIGGTVEACRLADQFVLVKCADQVNGGKVRWQTDIATDAARLMEFRKVDEFILRGGRKQPAGTRQQHARHEYSTLLVFGRK